MIQVRITEDILADGVSVWISRKYDGTAREILHAAAGGRQTVWTELEQQGTDSAGPTIRLTDEIARELLEALLRHYQGASDMHTLRADYLHERSRLDGLLRTLSAIAERCAL
jgi:hypothetical protein